MDSTSKSPSKSRGSSERSLQRVPRPEAQREMRQAAEGGRVHRSASHNNIATRYQGIPNHGAAQHSKQGKPKRAWHCVGRQGPKEHPMRTYEISTAAQHHSKAQTIWRPETFEGSSPLKAQAILKLIASFLQLKLIASFQTPTSRSNRSCNRSI